MTMMSRFVLLLPGVLFLSYSAKAFSVSYSQNSNIHQRIQYRKATSADIPSISQLLMDVFEDDVPKWNFLERNKLYSKYQTSLARRMDTLVKNGAQHISLVATTAAEAALPDKEESATVEESADCERIIGYMELGMLPSPLERGSKEYPYLANLAVSTSYRKQQIGSKLVKLAERIASKWNAANSKKYDEQESDYIDDPSQLCNSADKHLQENPPAEASKNVMFLAVDKDNLPAITLYNKLAYEMVLSEQVKVGIATQKQFEKVYKRKPRLYFQKTLLEDT